MSKPSPFGQDSTSRPPGCSSRAACREEAPRLEQMLDRPRRRTTTSAPMHLVARRPRPASRSPRRRARGTRRPSRASARRPRRARTRRSRRHRRERAEPGPDLEQRSARHATLGRRRPAIRSSHGLWIFSRACCLRGGEDVLGPVRVVLGVRVVRAPSPRATAAGSCRACGSAGQRTELEAILLEGRRRAPSPRTPGRRRRRTRHAARAGARRRARTLPPAPASRSSGQSSSTRSAVRRLLDLAHPRVPDVVLDPAVAIRRQTRGSRKVSAMRSNSSSVMPT